MAKCCGSRGCTCTVIAGLGVTVDGNGSPTSPYIISAGSASTALRVTDTPSVDLTLTGTGTAGAPYDVSAVVRLDPTPPGGGSNLISSGPEGLYVEMATGCGLAGAGTTGDPLTAAVAPWPYPCDISTAGSGIYCDPATGELRGDPKPYASSVSHFFTQTFNPPLPGPTAANQVIATFCATVTNPDPCRASMLVLAREADITVDLGPDSSIETGQTGDNMTRVRNLTDRFYQGWHDQNTKVLGGGVVAPGASVEVCFDAIAGRSEGTTSITAVQAILRAFFFTA